MRAELENEKEKVREGEVRARLRDVRENVENTKQGKRPQIVSIHASPRRVKYKSTYAVRHHLELRIIFLHASLVSYCMIYKNTPHILFAFSGGQSKLPACPD